MIDFLFHFRFHFYRNFIEFTNSFQGKLKFIHYMIYILLIIFLQISSMKSLYLLLVITLLSLSFSFQFFNAANYSVQGFTPFVSKFGEKTWFKNNTSSQQVIFDSSEEKFNLSAYKAAYDTILDYSQNPARKHQLLQCKKGPQAQFFKFGAAHVGFIGNKSDHESIKLEKREDDCFSDVFVNFTMDTHNSMNTATIQVVAINKRKQFCTQSYIFATASKLHVHNFILRNRHKFVWKNLRQLDYNSIKTWGIHIFRHCDSLNHKFPDIFKTIQVFAGGLGKNPHLYFFGSKPPLYMQKLNVDFIEAGTGYRWKQRTPHFVNLSQYQVKSGDFLAITRMDGLDQIIQYGSGSHAGHSALILQVDGVMSVVQSTDGWYWPKRGIQRNDWQTWKKWAMNADFSVVVLPLSQTSRKKFNVTAAQQFFKSKQGLPYGYHNFLFGWIDTPKDNYPPVLDPDFVYAGFSWLERIYEYPINRIMTQGLNKRLGVQGKKLSEIGILMTKKNLTFGDLMAIPQKDGWQYVDGQSYVCGAFVAAVYQAGGLLNEIQGTQFTPKDIYTMTIFDRNYRVPQKCKQNDQSLPYCQIMGRWLMELPGYATIEPYPHMAERCPTMPPEYYRPDGC